MLFHLKFYKKESKTIKKKQDKRDIYFFLQNCDLSICHAFCCCCYLLLDVPTAVFFFLPFCFFYLLMRKEEMGGGKFMKKQT